LFFYSNIKFEVQFYKIRPQTKIKAYQLEFLEHAEVSPKSKQTKESPTAVVIDTGDWKNASVPVVRNGNPIPRVSHSETVKTATTYDSRSEKTLPKAEGYEQIVSKLMNKRNRVEVYSRTWSSWFPCVVRPHSQANTTVVVYYYNGTDTIVKLLDPESPLIRTVQGPIYSIYCHSISKMYLRLCDRIRTALQFVKVKGGGMFSPKEYFCFTGRDFVTWLRSQHFGDDLEEGNIMEQLGNELLTRGIIWHVKAKATPCVAELSNGERDSNIGTKSEGGSLSFVGRADYFYALNSWSAIGELAEKEALVVREQEDRLYWTNKSSLGVYCSNTQKWELGKVVSTFDPWLLLVFDQDSQALQSKWVHRLDVKSVRHPRQFWRNGSQVWVFSRGDDLWYSGLVTSRETRYLGDQQAPLDEETLNVTYGPTDSQGAFTRTKSVKVSSEHIRPRVTRLSWMCIRIESSGEILQNVHTIKHNLAIYCKSEKGQRPYYDAQPDISTLILVCRNVKMTFLERQRESRLLSKAQNSEVKVEVIPWEVFTAGRDVLYKLIKPTDI